MFGQQEEERMGNNSDSIGRSNGEHIELIEVIAFLYHY